MEALPSICHSMQHLSEPLRYLATKWRDIRRMWAVAFGKNNLLKSVANFEPSIVRSIRDVEVYFENEYSLAW